VRDTPPSRSAPTSGDKRRDGGAPPRDAPSRDAPNSRDAPSRDAPSRDAPNSRDAPSRDAPSRDAPNSRDAPARQAPGVPTAPPVRQAPEEPGKRSAPLPPPEPATKRQRSSDGSGNAPKSSAGPCYGWRDNGHCEKGASCQFSHDGPRGQGGKRGRDNGGNGGSDNAPPAKSGKADDGQSRVVTTAAAARAKGGPPRVQAPSSGGKGAANAPSKLQQAQNTFESVLSGTRDPPTPQPTRGFICGASDVSVLNRAVLLRRSL